MFGVDTTEFIIVAIAALLFIGPKELPATMRAIGRWVGKIRGMARHFSSGIESVIREAELEEMERKWREENERIMQQYPGIEPSPEHEPQAEPDVMAEAQHHLQLEPPPPIPPEQRELP
jgi:sec-independent protein translocase protein TatB